MYDIPFKDLTEFYQTTTDDLKAKPYCDLEKMTAEMQKEKARNEAARNASDKEYILMLKTYFTAWNYLLTYWTEPQIIEACSRHLSKFDLVQKIYVKPDATCWQKPNEYLRTSMEYVPQYDPYGRQLMERKRERRDVYRVAHSYQSTKHGEIVLDLLYETYPELQEFQFRAYGIDLTSNYEIYPKNNIYTPLHPLMTQDIETIKKRNLEYAKSYNAGIYTPDQTKERLESNEAIHFFDVIRNLKKNTPD